MRECTIRLNEYHVIIIPVTKIPKTNERIALFSLTPRAAEPQHSKVERQYVHNFGTPALMMLHPDSSHPLVMSGRTSKCCDSGCGKKNAARRTLSTVIFVN